MVNYNKLGILGFVVGLALPAFLKTVSNLVSLIPGVALNLNAVVAQKTADAAGNVVLTVSTSGLTTAVNTGLGAKIGEFAAKLLSISPIPITGYEWIYAGIGGAAFFMLGGFVAEKFHWLSGSKVKQIATIGMVAGAIIGAIMSWSLNIPTIATMITTALTWIILATILVKVDEKFKLRLID